MAGSDIGHIECVGDLRQAVYQTSETSKKPQTTTEKITEFNNMGFEQDKLAISWRCIQSICELADRLHAGDGHYDPTRSQIESVPPQFAAHHGIFAIPVSHVEEYTRIYNPVILRWNRRARPSLCEGRTVFNFGESKGLGFERVLVIPTDKHAKFLSGDTTVFDDMDSDDSRNKLYVGITRARYSVAFLHRGGSVISGAQLWNP
jgi:DNA helicase-2/ATP-dependent DNA helicase PcrA